MCEHAHPLLPAWAGVSGTWGPALSPGDCWGPRALAPSHVFRESGSNVGELPRRPLEEEDPPILQRRRPRLPGPQSSSFWWGWRGLLGWKVASRKQLLHLGEGSALVTWVWRETRAADREQHTFRKGLGCWAWGGAWPPPKPGHRPTAAFSLPVSPPMAVTQALPSAFTSKGAFPAMSHPRGSWTLTPPLTPLGGTGRP